jgi:hypothetical protein
MTESSRACLPSSRRTKAIHPLLHGVARGVVVDGGPAPAMTGVGAPSSPVMTGDGAPSLSATTGAAARSSHAMTGDGAPLSAMTTARARRLVTSAMTLSCLAFTLLAGCAQTDPYLRPGMWRPDGVNDGNIAAMVQDSRDLVRGHAAQGPEWMTPAAAVDRLWQDKPKPLLLGTPPAQGGTGGADAAPPATGTQ